MEKIKKAGTTIVDGEGIYDKVFTVFRISTTKQTIRIGIDNETSCCETFGIKFNEISLKGRYIKEIKQLDHNYFEFSNIVEDSDTDSDADSGDSPIRREGTRYEGITIVLDNDEEFVVCVYNEHNGYYNHSYFIKYNDVYREGVI